MSKRTVIEIDESLCDGCGLCAQGCPEGALRIIDGKARMVGESLCDGLGACIGECPRGAITQIEREAEPYSERKVIENILPQGRSTVLAHLNHLRSHGQDAWYGEALAILKEKGQEFSTAEVDAAAHAKAGNSGHGAGGHQGGHHGHRESHGNREADGHHGHHGHHHGGGCPGSAMRSFAAAAPGAKPAAPVMRPASAPAAASQGSALEQWPVQLHLVNPRAPYFQGADLLIAADCTAFACGAFHQALLRGRRLVIACPKLDDGQNIYVDKIQAMIDQGGVESITVAIMEVPCCGGLSRLVNEAASRASRKVPVSTVVVGIEGGSLTWM